VLSTIHARGAGLPPVKVKVFPNPTAEGATFLIRAAGQEPTRASLFDAQGRRVRSFEAVRGEGFHTVDWDGADQAGNRVSTGVYFLKVTGPGGNAKARVVLVR
jgi:flagellar hook assembly protein FlgD